MEKNCLKCGHKYFATRYKQTLCSECVKFKKGEHPWNIGKSGYMSQEARRSIGDACIKRIKNETSEQREKRTFKFRTLSRKGRNLGKIGEKCKVWKGEEASYNSKHRWIQKHWIKTGTCEECGSTPIPNPLKRLKVGTYWHNPSRTYRRERNEWMEVCAKCHYQLDHKIL